MEIKPLNKFRFSKEITLGDLTLVVGMVLPMIIWLLRMDARMEHLTEAVNKQGGQIEALATTQGILATDQAIVKTMLEERTSRK